MSPLHIPIKEHYIIMDENNRRESIEFKISVSIGTQDTTYDYNDEFWDSIQTFFDYLLSHINL